jgi:DNA-binding IclR family transcriptional regulator
MKSDADTRQDRYAIHSVEKAFDVMEVLSQYDSLNLVELSELLGQPKSSLYRIILTLEKRCYITRDDSTGKYCLGLKPLEITRNVLEKNKLRSLAVPEMNRLVQKYDDTVNLGLLSGESIIYVEILEGTYSLRMSEKIGSKAPFHASAMGKTILSFLPEAEIVRYVSKENFQIFTPNTIVDINQLKQQLVMVRTQGYAFDDEEIVQGARCIAAPIFNMFGKIVGAISLSGAVHRLSDEAIVGIATDVKRSTDIISRKLGYSPSHTNNMNLSIIKER